MSVQAYRRAASGRPTHYQPQRPWAGRPTAYQPGWAFPTPSVFHEIEYPEPLDPEIEKFVVDPFKVWYPGLYHPYGALTGVRGKDLDRVRRMTYTPAILGGEEDQGWMELQGSAARRPEIFNDVEAEVLEALGFDPDALELGLQDSFGKAGGGLFRRDPATGRSKAGQISEKVSRAAAGIVTKLKKLDESSFYKTMPAPPLPAPPPPEPPPVVPPAGGVDASTAMFGLALLAVGLGLGVGLSRASDR